MNELLRQMQIMGVTPGAGLDVLQLAGVVSDECVRIQEVAEADAVRAAHWLRGRRAAGQLKQPGKAMLVG